FFIHRRHIQKIRDLLLFGQLPECVRGHQKRQDRLDQFSHGPVRISSRFVRRIVLALGVCVGIVVFVWTSFNGMKLLMRGDFERAVTTVATLDDLARAMDTYKDAHGGRYPPAKSIGELRAVLVPKYLTQLRDRAGWGRP